MLVPRSGVDLQYAISRWTEECFGKEIAKDKTERNHRFLEEALELVQACGCTKEDAIDLVNYVFDRPEGEIKQEVGGAIVTLMALCSAYEGVDVLTCGKVELQRVVDNIEKIRLKHKNKPKFGARPQ